MPIYIYIYIFLFFFYFFIFFCFFFFASQLIRNNQYTVKDINPPDQTYSAYSGVFTLYILNLMYTIYFILLQFVYI